MFIEHSTTIDLGLDTIEKGLSDVRSEAGEWANLAYREGEQLRSRVGPGDNVARSVTLDIGMPEIHTAGIVYPIKWTATGATLLFPSLEADLVLSKQGANRTTITLKGTYEPPLGPLGKLVDRAGLGRVAEATVRNWMDRLEEALSSSV